MSINEKVLYSGPVDVLLLTAFIGCAHYFLNIALTDLVTQFLLPMVVTACICFVTLGMQQRNGWLAIGLCVLWSGVWWAIAANNQLYSAITIPIWLAIFSFAFLFLAFAIYRLLKNCDNANGESHTGLSAALMGRVDGGIAPSDPHRIPDLRLSRIRLFTRLID